jgi:hypothetical protein
VKNNLAENGKRKQQTEKVERCRQETAAGAHSRRAAADRFSFTPDP